MNVKENLGSEILTLYSRSIFGKVSKAEIDLVVFGSLVRMNLEKKKDIFEDGDLNWFRLEAEHIRVLSIKLKIPETRVSTLLEQCALYELDNDIDNTIILNEIKHLVYKVRQSPKEIEEGKIRLYVPNKFTRAAIESLLVKGGGLPETSFNQNQLVIRLIDLVPCFNNSPNKENSKFLEEVAQIANNFSKTKEIKDIIKAANKKKGSEQVRDLSKAVLKVALGDGGEYIGKTLFEWFDQAG